MKKSRLSEMETSTKHPQQEAGVFRLVFSSSATVYGSTAKVPYAESAPLGLPTNPYGWSKLVVERVLSDLATSDPR